MNKSKKTIEALRAYLGNDTRGTALLDDVSRAMTEIRHAANADRELAATASANATRSNELRLAAVELVQQLKQQVNIANAKLLQRDGEIGLRQNEIDSLRATIEKLQPEIEADHLAITIETQNQKSLGHRSDEYPAALLNAHDLASTFRELRKAVSVCPSPEYCKRLKLSGYRLDSVVTGYSPADMMTLGRFVTCLAMFNFPSAIFSPAVAFKPERELQDRHMAGFVRWFRNNFTVGKTEARVMDACCGNYAYYRMRGQH